MVSISGSKKLKRQMAPLFWRLKRKDKRFVVVVRPGPHGKHVSVPTAVFLRDVLGMVTSLREAKAAIYSGKVSVDGVTRKSLHHAIGLMDVVELDGLDEAYRMVPADGRLLAPIKALHDERDRKIVKVKSKTSIPGGRTQIGFHDGRSMIINVDVKVGDSCLIRVPSQQILEIIRFKEGCQALVTRGINAGSIGTIKKIENGTFILPRRVLLALGDREIEIPADIIMPVGNENPVIKVR